MKTRAEWLNELPDGYRELAIASADNDGCMELQCHSASVALSGAFVWSDSTEGHEFWNSVWSNLERKTQLPPLP